MPLHLLGKKSWNVYNPINVDRVKRDEAEAKAKEEAEEQRMQEEDAQRRIALLRGELPPAASRASDDLSRSRPDKRQDLGPQRDRKRKRRRGEDDTDRDIRYARLDAEAGAKAQQTLLQGVGRDAALQDPSGNIQLFAAPSKDAMRRMDRGALTDVERAYGQRPEIAQHATCFRDVAGRNGGTGKPWYITGKTSPRATDGSTAVLADVQSKDVWGNEDPLRKQREHDRLSSRDPLAAMKQAQRQLKQSERDREGWREKQAAERAAASHSRHRPRGKRRRYREEQGLDGFSLDEAIDARHGHRNQGTRRRSLDEGSF